MKVLVALIIALFVSDIASAQSFPPIQPYKREIRQVSNPAMVMQAGRARIEIFPSQRVEVARNSAGTLVMSEKSSNSAKRLSISEPVLVFNHAYQQFGYATGEIAFKFKDGKSLAMVKSIVPGAEAVGTQFYVVNVQTPADILSVTQRLKGRTDIDWVIPTIRYLPLASQARE